MMTTKPPAEQAAEAELLHPYIVEALAAARRGDLDALGWLRNDCAAWWIVSDAERGALFFEIYRPRPKPRRTKAKEG